jgi:hypothetical protein
MQLASRSLIGSGRYRLSRTKLMSIGMIVNTSSQLQAFFHPTLLFTSPVQSAKCGSTVSPNIWMQRLVACADGPSGIRNRITT